MAVTRKDRIRARRRALRVRGTLRRGSLPRVTVFRSLKQIYGQLIDDRTGNTIAAASSFQSTGVNGDKKVMARAVGKELAKRAKEKGIDRVIFDRGRYRYHGRVQALAEGLREGGITI